MPRYVYQFGAGEADGRSDQRALLGGKGANLAEMTSLGIPVPPGFTLTTEVCNYFFDNDQSLPDALETHVEAAMDRVGELTNAIFGSPTSPLLVSVRSGSAASMPGMMDTVLNLGLNDETVKALAEKTGDERFAYDCYRRFVAMYGEVVMGVGPASEVDESPFVRILEDMKAAREVDLDSALPPEDLRALVTEYKIEILRQTNAQFPENPLAQLWGAIGAVFRSWNNKRARAFRRMSGIADSLGTAVNVQAMVFGNIGLDSGTGVAFTRDPATGANELFGEFLLNAQGEEVVAGHRTPRPISELKEAFPAVYEELDSVGRRLERHFCDMQDLEFTIQSGKLWLLQTRTGKRSGRAMIRMAVEQVAEGLIDVREAVRRIEPNKLDEVLHPAIDSDSRPPVLTSGRPASPGAAIGRVVFTASEADEWSRRGEAVILVRVDTSPEDIVGMQAAAGIITARGGMTSHAAVVARGMGKSCVTGASELRVEIAKNRFSVGDQVVSRGDYVSVDGTSGEIFLGRASLVPARLDSEFETLMEWVDEIRRLRVRTNADTPADARTARAFGAEGIGLCRTEHMFFEPDRIQAMRRMILADGDESRREALEEMLPMQRNDFVSIFEVMDGLPVTVRLLDPPLHEFLPTGTEEISHLAKDLGTTPSRISQKMAELHEVNPMLGHRGCRLAVAYPQVYEMQARAIAEAIVEADERGIATQIEIMIPFVALPDELALVRKHVSAVVDDVLARADLDASYLIGTMIELPRACLVADAIAEYADFFSFGTNDLTQTTYGFSRDDASRFLPAYVNAGVLGVDPFVVLDRDGVGALLRIAVEKGRAVKTKLKVGICGEHGGEPASVEFCHVEGFDYVSCSPFRVPVARVAAARAALRGEARSK